MRLSSSTQSLTSVAGITKRGAQFYTVLKKDTFIIIQMWKIVKYFAGYVDNNDHLVIDIILVEYRIIFWLPKPQQDWLKNVIDLQTAVQYLPTKMPKASDNCNLSHRMQLMTRDRTACFFNMFWISLPEICDAHANKR